MLNWKLNKKKTQKINNRRSLLIRAEKTQNDIYKTKNQLRLSYFKAKDEDGKMKNIEKRKNLLFFKNLLKNLRKNKN